MYQNHQIIMKEKSNKSRNHNRGNEHPNILKEKYYRGMSDSKEEVSKSQRRRSRERSNGRRDSCIRKNDRKARDESYEELSRKKRKIESELHALDLEEAAARKVDNRKPEKHKSKHEKSRYTKVKEEPLSDENDTMPLKTRMRNRRSPEKNDDRKPKESKDNGSWGNPKEEIKKVEKEKPNFAVSGKLAEDTNTYNGVVIKYNEPSEARKPRRRWRLYPFKGDSDLPFIPIHRQSAYLFGRTRSIADIPIDHPSCSKQHAVLQFRLIPYKRDDGTTGRRVRPYIIDLESSNGTFINNKRIDPRCYVEIIEKDVVKFGYSSREYVLLHEESKNDDEDDDVRDSN